MMLDSPRPVMARKPLSTFVTCTVILGSLSAMATLVLLVLTVLRVQTFAASAPAIISGEISKQVPQVLDAYVKKTLVPGIQEQMVGWMLGRMPPTPAPAADEAMVARMKACPVSSAELCSAFTATCNDFQTCRTTRDGAACTKFVHSVGRACALNTCDVYRNQDLCVRVTTLCNERMRCAFNMTACVAMESDLAGVCQQI